MDLNDRLDEVINQSTSKFNIIKDNVSLIFYIRILQINLIGKQIEEENERAANFLDKKNNYIKILEQKIDERFNQEAQIREEGDDNLDKKVTEEIMQVQEVIINDKKNREQTEEAILEMLRVLVTKSKADIEAEREEREKTEETLIALLEDTCSKLTEAQQEKGYI